MYHGILNIRKEKGYTSHDVVAKLRGIVKQKKIGHTGTLDPEAEGVLPVCLGLATKVCGLLTDQTKTYRTELKLGVVTDTQDLTGKVLQRQEVVFDQERFQTILSGFTGEIEQIPPMYSARKVNGKKLYELARAGKEVDREARPVTVHSIDVLGVLPGEGEISMEICCSKGTYIRTLCHDIGAAYGCGGAMKSLVRTRVGRFTWEGSLRLAEIEDREASGTLHEVLLPVDDLFEDYPSFYVKPDAEKRLQNGNPLTARQGYLVPEQSPQGQRICRVYDCQKRFCALYQYDCQNLIWKPYQMFFTGED